MITITGLAAEAVGSYLAEHMGRRFGSTDGPLVDLVQSAARLAVDCIGNSNALYHNVEHTMLVTLVGYDILKGRRLLTKPPQPILRTFWQRAYFTTLATSEASSTVRIMWIVQNYSRSVAGLSCRVVRTTEELVTPRMAQLCRIFRGE